MKELTVPAALDKLDEVLVFIESELEPLGCSMKALSQINIAVEEIFVNIAHYAYKPEDGDATVKIEIDGESVSAIIQIIDEGAPYDPLAKDDPDITQTAEERSIGGLGIYMVKKIMDKVEYMRIDDKNILTLRKKLA